jgi:hypothetical protein
MGKGKDFLRIKGVNMKGNNTIELNTASMIEALQEYLDKRMGEYAPKVTDVKYSKPGYDTTFNISVSEQEKV